jgi:hypothetical protein
MATLSKKLPPLMVVLVLVLAGCGNVRVCSGNCLGGLTDPPFTATLNPTYLSARRGDTMAGPLVVNIRPEYPTPFIASTCLRKRDNSDPPPGIYLTGTDPDNPWSCLMGRVEGTTWHEVFITVRHDVLPGVYYLRLRVANEAVVRNLDFVLEVE